MKNLCFFIAGIFISIAGYAQGWISLNSGTSIHLRVHAF
jgi:hypothetical protein